MNQLLSDEVLIDSDVIDNDNTRYCQPSLAPQPISSSPSSSKLNRKKGN